MSVMLADVVTVIWKEWKEFVRQRSAMLSIFIFLGVFGLFFPAQRGEAWVHSQVPLVNAIILPVMLVLSVVADSFAGERERHTLETLLASRLSDRAILIGKFIAVLVYAWGLTLAGLLAGLITVNVSHPAEAVTLYPRSVAVGSLVFGLLGGGFAASAGILISLRSATVRQAAQTLSVGMMVLFFGATTIGTALPRAWREGISDAARDAGTARLVVFTAMTLLTIDLALLAVAAARFRRARLILD